MKEQQILPDEKWNSIYLSKPENGQICMSKVKGHKGYVGQCIYNNGNFETYEDDTNRFIIIRWKHDLWLPV